MTALVKAQGFYQGFISQRGLEKAAMLAEVITRTGFLQLCKGVRRRFAGFLGVYGIAQGP